MLGKEDSSLSRVIYRDNPFSHIDSGVDTEETEESPLPTKKVNHL